MSEKKEQVKVLIDTIEKVKDFVSRTSQFNADLDIVSGKYVINAKSILGLFSLDLSKPVTLRVEGTPEEITKVNNELAPFIVEQ